MEANSLGTVRRHLTHFERTLGGKFPLQQLTLADLQWHVSERAKKTYRGKSLSPVTLKKEMASLIHSPVEAVWLESRLEPVFGPKTGSSRDSNQTAFTGSWIRAAWNWAAHTGLVKGIFPSKGFVYPKADEKPPVITWQEIERKLHHRMTAKEPPGGLQQVDPQFVEVDVQVGRPVVGALVLLEVRLVLGNPLLPHVRRIAEDNVEPAGREHLGERRSPVERSRVDRQSAITLLAARMLWSRLVSTLPAGPS